MASKGWTILLVDDEADILDSLKDLLEEGMRGATVVTRPSGSAALALLAATSGIQLIVSDFKMPGMDGIQFLTEAKRRYPYIPRVMLTAYPSPELEGRAKDEASVDAFLSKAGDPVQITVAIKRLALDLQKRLGYDVPG